MQRIGSEGEGVQGMDGGENGGRNEDGGGGGAICLSPVVGRACVKMRRCQF